MFWRCIFGGWQKRKYKNMTICYNCRWKKLKIPDNTRWKLYAGRPKFSWFKTTTSQTCFSTRNRLPKISTPLFCTRAKNYSDRENPLFALKQKFLQFRWVFLLQDSTLFRKHTKDKLIDRNYIWGACNILYLHDLFAAIVIVYTRKAVQQVFVYI